MREKDGTCSTFFSLSLSSFQLFAGPSVREKKTEQHRSRTLIKFPVSLFPPTFLILPHSLILFLYVYSFLFYFILLLFLYSFASIYSRHYYSIYRVCVCIFCCVEPPHTVKLKVSFRIKLSLKELGTAE